MNNEQENPARLVHENVTSVGFGEVYGERVILFPIQLFPVPVLMVSKMPG